MISLTPDLLERRLADRALTIAVEEDLRDTLRTRSWYMGPMARVAFSEGWRRERMHDLRVEIGVLVMVLRKLRDIETKRWTESESRFAWGDR